MIGKNIINLRKNMNLSQEDIADKIGVSRQTIAKWESGESVPDILHCNALAELFGISLDNLVNFNCGENCIGKIPPKGKFIFGTVTVGEKGQIVIPVKARNIFNIKSGDSLMVLGDINQGIALMNVDFFIRCIDEIQSSRGDS